MAQVVQLPDSWAHGTDRQTLMQTLDDDKDAGYLFLRQERILKRRLNLQGCADRLLMPSY